MQGYGKYYYKNGEYYIGEWKNDLRHGKGTLYNQNGGIKFEGQFYNDNQSQPNSNQMIIPYGHNHFQNYSQIINNPPRTPQNKIYINCYQPNNNPGPNYYYNQPYNNQGPYYTSFYQNNYQNQNYIQPNYVPQGNFITINNNYNPYNMTGIQININNDRYGNNIIINNNL